jgi:hypothetical protein
VERAPSGKPIHDIGGSRYQQDRIMLDIAGRALTALLLIAETLMPGVTSTPVPAAPPEQARVCGPTRRQPADSATGALPFARTELYFGAAMPEGVVAEEAFREFIDEHVAPLFPDGLTVVTAEGRFRAADRTFVKEPSFVLVLLYPCQALADGSRRIDRIRTLYKQLFAQQSVLRVDDPQIVWVSY